MYNRIPPPPKSASKADAPHAGMGRFERVAIGMVVAIALLVLAILLRWLL